MQKSALPVELLSKQPLPGGYTQLLLRIPPRTAIPQPGGCCRIFNGNHSISAPIMRCQGEVLECLYRNSQTGHPRERLTDGQLSVILVDSAWHPNPDEPQIVFLAQNEGLACVVYAADLLHAVAPQTTLTAFLEFNDSPPFTPKPSQILLPGSPSAAVACAPLLEDWGIASRLADPCDRRIPKPGWFAGTAVNLAERWFESITDNVRLACCGSQNFIQDALSLANRRQLPVDVTVLQEYEP